MDFTNSNLGIPYIVFLDLSSCGDNLKISAIILQAICMLVLFIESIVGIMGKPIFLFQDVGNMVVGWILLIFTIITIILSIFYWLE